MRYLSWLLRRDTTRSLPELGVLASLFAAAAAALAFGNITGEVLEGDTEAFDRMVLLFFRHADDLSNPIGPHWLEDVFREITSLGSVTVLTIVVVLTMGYLLLDGKKAAALLVLISVAGGGMLNRLMKGLFDRERPDIVPHLVNETSLSYPSGHAMASAVTYLTIGVMLARTQQRPALKVYFFTAAVTLSLLIGSSRVYLGVHWPTDVLAGWTAGSAWAMGIWVIASWLHRRGTD
jgi:undecaprenyl-diphosphatase